MFSHSSTSKLWGEIPTVPEPEWERIVPKELGKLVLLSAIKHELPKPYQPVPDESCNNIIQIPKECTAMDPVVLDTIKLLQHARKVQELLDIANSDDEENVAEKIKNCPPFPEISDKRDSKKNQDKNVEYCVLQENELSPFAAGKPVEHFRLSSDNARQVLQKSVATLIAHTGFDYVAESFFCKFTLHLRHAVDEEILHGPSMFPDIMEHVYYKMGLGSIRSIQGFYQTQILDYREKVRNDCLKLVGEYQVCCALLQVKDPPYDIRFKKEEGDDNDIPEIHFPAAGEGDGVDELQPSLEPEFQMLEMLEQEVHSVP
ncbi:STAGA complex 65 subunit gamma-like isoform X2 [Lycorma delicatula]|uniref:STAGA complex 65 subunit gamma-like isoform X2 n=1 Tax=Lycorma delicatula TaxID=130591 RepID=UPI003F513598